MLIKVSHRSSPVLDLSISVVEASDSTQIIYILIGCSKLNIAKGFCPQNLVQGSLVNGSTGQVIDFQTPEKAREGLLEIAQVNADDENTTPGIRRKGGQERNKINEENIKGRLWPVVRFLNGKELLCVPTSFSVENVLGGIEAIRDQVSAT